MRAARDDLPSKLGAYLLHLQIAQFLSVVPAHSIGVQVLVIKKGSGAAWRSRAG